MPNRNNARDGNLGQVFKPVRKIGPYEFAGSKREIFEKIQRDRRLVRRLGFTICAAVMLTGAGALAVVEKQYADKLNADLKCRPFTPWEALQVDVDGAIHGTRGTVLLQMIQQKCHQKAIGPSPSN